MIRPVINAKSGLYAILGDPIDHSLSPVIMNSMFARLGMDNVFVALKANRENIGRILPVLLELGFTGLVFTMPVKEDAANMVDRLEAEAELTGVTNCVVNRNGLSVGHNTDSVGFWTSVMEKTDRPPASAFILGAGGFARAAAAQAALRGVKRIWVVNREEDAPFTEGFARFSAMLRDRCSGLVVEMLDWRPDRWGEALAAAEVVANATPNGLRGKGDLHSVFPYDKVGGRTVFFDAVYDPLETEFLASARRRGHPIVGGLDLLAHQGARSFEIWTGVKVSPAEMKSDALKFLKTV